MKHKKKIEKFYETIVSNIFQDSSFVSMLKSHEYCVLFSFMIITYRKKSIFRRFSNLHALENICAIVNMYFH